MSLKYELLFLDQANLSSVPFQILILQYPIPRASLSSSPSPSNFTLANRNPSSTQPSSCSSSVSPFCLTQCDTTGKLLDILNQVLSQANQIYYQTIYKSNYLIGQTSHLSKNWAFKSRFSFKVRQHGQHRVYLQYKVCWILYKMVSAFSFSQPYMWIQPPPQSPPKISSTTSTNFHLPIPSLLVHKIILTIPTNTPFLYISSTPPYVCVQPSLQSTSKVFLYHSHLSNLDESRNQWARESCEDWHYFNLSPLPKSIDRDNRVHYR